MPLKVMKDKLNKRRIKRTWGLNIDNHRDKHTHTHPPQFSFVNKIVTF